MTESCRYCAKPLTRVLVDLGKTALANSYVTPGTPAPDPAYELCSRVCDDCFLVQVADAVPADAIFSDYAYFSSFSTSWLAHCEAYAETMISRFGLGPQDGVMELVAGMPRTDADWDWNKPPHGHRRTPPRPAGIQVGQGGAALR